MWNTTHPVMVITDHANLQYYREPQKIGPRVNGYIVELADYNIQLVYKPGASNKADELSRRPDMAPEDEEELVIVLPDHLFAPMESPSKAYVATCTKPEDYSSDSGYESEGPDDSRHVVKNLADDSRDVLKDLALENTALKAHAANLGDGYTISAFELDQKIEKAQGKDASTLRQWERAHGIRKQGNLWTKEGALVVVGNNELKRGVISLFHDPTTAGHPGITKTLALTRQYYWWPNMKNFTTEYVKGCATCQMSKINTNPSKPALSPITPEPNALPFQTVSLDFIVKLPESEGFDTILTITDHDCSKAAIFTPCNEAIDAAGVAKLYATYVFPHYGLPKKVISDRDPRFASNFSKEMCSLLGIKQNISTAYHPQTDGQSERTNQSLEQYLRLYCGTHQKDWAAWLPLAQYTRNSWPNASTKKTPYELILGYTPLAHQPVRDTTVPDIDTRMQLIKDAREQAQEALKQTQENMIKETRFKEFVIGQKVWLEGKNIKRPYDSPKLSPKRYGPFRVVAKISSVAYKLQIPATWQIHDVFHASLLTPYRETVEHGENFLEPPPDIIEGEEEWEVEQILGKRIFGRSKKLQFLVRWKGYSPAHDQWVNKEDMAADDLVRIFERENPHDAPVQRPARSKRIRATTVDFDSPDIASSREASVEPADMGILAAWARTKKTHWAQSLNQKERTRINGLVLLARAALAFRAKHGRFPWKLRHGFFNLVHRLGRIKGKLTAYPADFTATDFGKLDSLIKCFRVIHDDLQPFVGVPVEDKRKQSKSRTPPVSSVGSAPTLTSSFTPGTLLPLDIPLAPPTSTPTVMPCPAATVPRMTHDVTADPGWEQLLCETFAPKYKAPVVTPILSPMEATLLLRLSPPAAAAPLEDPVSMLDQPELTPEWEAYLKQSTPPDIGIKRKREPSPTFGKNYPTKKDSPFSTPHRTPHIPSAPMSYAPTRLPSPEPLPPAAPAAPVTEETDLRVQQVPWEGHDVTIPAITPTFSSPSRPAASPEVPRDTSSSHVPLRSHVIHPHAPSCTLPPNPISHPQWVRLRELPPSTPDAPDEPESSPDLRIDSAAMTKDLSILQGLLSGLPMSLWSAVPDIDMG